MSEKSIRQALQDNENEYGEGYQLLSDLEIIDIISDFGNGVTEFHTLDIERLIREHNAMKEHLTNIIDHQYGSGETLARLNGAISTARDFLKQNQ